MRFESSRKRRAVGGLTPLIDVVFLLLVFFMLAASFESEGSLPIAIGEPPADDDAGEAPRGEIHIAIGASGALWVEGGPTEPDGLARALERLLASDPSRPVRIESHPDAALQSIVTVLSILDGASATDVALRLAAAEKSPLPRE